MPKPKKSGIGENRGTAIHKVYRPRIVRGVTPSKSHSRGEKPKSKAVSGQPIKGKNRPGSHPIRGG